MLMSGVQDGSVETLSSGGDTTIDNNTPKETTITRKNCERKCTGMYKILVQNKHGEDDAEIEVVVLGKLVVSSICNKQYNPLIRNC